MMLSEMSCRPATPSDGRASRILGRQIHVLRAVGQLAPFLCGQPFDRLDDFATPERLIEHLPVANNRLQNAYHLMLIAIWDVQSLRTPVSSRTNKKVVLRGGVLDYGQGKPRSACR
jgi:hypothetical protein